jgi:hypothetical protein
MHRERDLGSLEQGKLADFVVVDRSPLGVEPDRLRTSAYWRQSSAGSPPSTPMIRPWRQAPAARFIHRLDSGRADCVRKSIAAGALLCPPCGDRARASG